jgi:hypothetical protein
MYKNMWLNIFEYYSLHPQIFAVLIFYTNFNYSHYLKNKVIKN